MAALRFCLIVVFLAACFLVGAPLQWIVARRTPRHAHHIPILFCRTLLRLIRVRVSLHGTRTVGEPVLLVANHVSWIDILALGSITPFCFLAKSDVAGWPVVSAFAEVQGTVFVDRLRRRSLPATNRQMAARMLEGRTVLLFPEGTTVGKPGPARFHSSLFASARALLAVASDVESVAVQPVAVDYSTDAAAWVGADNLLSHLWRTLNGRSIRCSLSFGAPVRYLAGSDRKKIAIETRASVIAMLRLRSAEAGLHYDYDSADVTAADLVAELARHAALRAAS